MSVFLFFAYFGEPISQTAQTLLPPILDQEDARGPALEPSPARALFFKLLRLAATTGAGVGLASGLLLTLGAPLFTSDPCVVAAVRCVAPAVLLCQLQLPLTTTVDGAMVAAKDFQFVAAMAVGSCALQLAALHAVSLHGGGSLVAIWLTLFLRLAAYAAAASRRWLAMRNGPLDLLQIA
jgi:Na+-driven multidrug efflux pump